MLQTLLFAAAVVLPTDAHVVRVAADRWPQAASTEALDAPKPGERIWWWSKTCAPRLITADAPAADCAEPVQRIVIVAGERGKPIANARVLWGPAEMLADVPDALLPSSETDENGRATILSRPGESMYARAAGPRQASWWQKISPAKDPVRLTASPAAPLHTEVRLSGNESPARAIVEVEPATLVVLPQDVRSWGVGERATVDIPPLPHMAAQYTAWCDGCAPAAGNASTERFPSSLVLEEGAKLLGRVVDGRGTPLSGVAVEAVFAMPSIARGLRRRAASDRDGRFAVADLTRGQVQLRFRKQGFASVSRAVNAATAPRPLDDVVLRPGRAVIVHVLDRQNKPVAGARVMTNEGLAGVTGARGTTTLEGLPAGDGANLTVSAAGYKTAAGVPVPWKKAAVDVVLSRGVLVRGTIRNAATREIAPAAEVLVVNNGVRRLETLADGHLEIGGLNAGTLSLEVRAAGLLPYRMAERKVADEEVVSLGELLLPAGDATTGRLVAHETGAPVAAATIRALRRSASGPIGAFALRDWSETTSADDGSFALSGLEPGPQVLMIEAAGFAPRVVTSNGSSNDLGTLELDRARELVIRCKPAPRCGSEARVLIGGADYPWAFVAGAMQDGIAHVLPVAPGRVTLRLSNRGQLVAEREADVSSASDSTEIEIALSAVSVTGTVLSGTRPQAGGHVELVPAAAGPPVIPVMIESRTAEGMPLATQWLQDMPQIADAGVDDDGHFQFADIAPGTYTARYSRNGTAGRSLRIDVPDREGFRFTIDVPTGEVQGHAIDDDGAPVKFARIEVRDAAGSTYSGQSSIAGDFDIAGIAPGRATVQATTAASEGEASVTIDERDPVSVDVTLKKKERDEIAVRVADASGRPLSGAAVFFIGDEPSIEVATTDGSGVAALKVAHGSAGHVVGFDARAGWSWTRRNPGDLAASLQMAAATGSIVVTSRTTTAVQLYASDLPLHRALALAGYPVQIRAGGELRIDALPPGSFVVSGGAAAVPAAVRAGESSRISLP